MQTLLDAARHIAQEIDSTRQRLQALELALQGLTPLITIETSATTLGYSTTARLQSVEDVAPADAEPAHAPKRKAREVLPRRRSAAATALPATGTAVWEQAMGRKKLSMEGVVSATLALLELDVDARKTIKGRASVWLHSAVKRDRVRVTVGRDGHNRYQRVKP